MPIRKEILDELLGESFSPEDVLGENGILKQLTKAVVERALETEMTAHLGYSKHAPEGRDGGNSRNGKSRKRLTTDLGLIELEVPRDRDGQFEPQIVRKRQRRIEGFDDKILSMYARGMTTRDIQEHLEEIYGVEVSPDLISSVTAAVLDEVRTWQSRPLEPIYPIIYLDALFVTTRESGPALRKAVYIALAVRMDGHKEVLGMWMAETEGAKFWLNVLNELKNRGLKDAFIACVDGLTGFADAIEAAFPRTLVQQCIVHQVRNSLSYANWKSRKRVAADLRRVYTAATEADGLAALDEFDAIWGSHYPMIARSWRANWPRLATFFQFPDYIRKAIYTTNAVESINASMKKLIRNRGLFPNDEAVFKLLYLGLLNAEKKWTQPIPRWREALNQFAILFEDRFPTHSEFAFTQNI